MNRFYSRFVLLALLLTCALPLRATGETAGAYFAVIVADIEQSASWYQSVFDLAEQSRLTDDNNRFEIINLSGPGLFVELLELKGASDRPDGRIKGLFKVGFLVNDLRGFVANLPSSTSHPEIVTDTKNMLLIAQLRDPDGNTVQVMEALDRQEQ